MNYTCFFWIASFLALTHCSWVSRHCEERSNPEKQIDGLYIKKK
jgi:hypothetical protein